MFQRFRSALAPPWRPRRPRFTTSLVVGMIVTALTGAGVAALVPRAAADTCGSTPIAQSFADAVGDNGSDYDASRAPDVAAVDVRLDGACNLAATVQLADHGDRPGILSKGEFVALFVDVDGDQLTGNSDGADRVLAQGPGTERVLGTWDGSEWALQPAPGQAEGWGGVVAPAGSLGVTGAGTIRVWAYTDYAESETAGASAVDIAPDAGDGYGVTLAMTGRPDVGDEGGGDLGGGAACKVPRVRRMFYDRGIAKLSRAGCWYSLRFVNSRKVGKYRVVSTSPKAGRRTSKTVVVRVAYPKRRRLASVAGIAAALADPMRAGSAAPPVVSATSSLSGPLPRAFKTPLPSATMAEFLSQTLANVHGYWSQQAAAGGKPMPRVRYRWPGRRPIRGCDGEKTGDDTAYYCSINDTIYVSQVFARMLWDGYEGADGVVASGDFAVASAIAHEYAHNRQTELGVFTRSYGPTVMPTELHADCMAGMWSRWAEQQGLLDPGDVDEAVTVFEALGDYGTDDPGHHGTPAQRRAAWLRGYNGGENARCGALLRTRT